MAEFGAMQNSTCARKYSTAEERQQVLQSYRESSLTQKEFATQAGISLSTLHAWLKKASEGKGPPRGFVAVPNLLTAQPAPAAYRLQWPGGLTLEVRSGFAAAELAALLQLLPPL